LGLDLLFDRYGARLYNMSFVYLKSKEEAEEVVQDVLLKLWQNATAIDNEGHLEGYMFKTTKNLLLNRLRTRSRKERITEELSIDVVDTTTADQALLLNEMQDFLSQAIQGMPAKRQAIFKMSRIDGFSNKQIASALDISEKTVENQIGRAIKYLRAYMAHIYSAFTLLFI